MFEDLNLRLAVVKEKGRNYEKWEQRLQALEIERAEQEEQAGRWRKKLSEEENDVDRLMGMTLSNLIYSMIGKKEEKLEREQIEVLEVKLKYDESVRTLEDIEKQMDNIRYNLERISDWEVEYEHIMREKEQYIVHHSRELVDIAEAQTDLTLRLKELKEAINAGISVMDSLDNAVEGLKSASHWGTYDMLGGGMISTHIKHNHIDEAMDYVHEARKGMGHFEKELNDIQMSLSVDIDIGAILTFSDYFFDGIIADWMVQGRIQDTLSNVENKATAISQLLGRLDEEYDSLELELVDTKRQYISIIEHAK
ncbi:hypothetical protein [Paenibacillus sp. IHBB 10380]|uniref:hypothetical protein n=1 Tax=Paenibacillus sp. IHBB 10380 TaxID=1566358 RepID=UPI0005CFD5A6|nr:hypothetical protein [Paenibacillus sp. IHBB 10380]AJS61263.1 hypothetical protein UB51_25685 [Paenibacillus sp. IHBB 10380]